ncbi:unnamed protein product [Rhodiola kirilowii]
MDYAAKTTSFVIASPIGEKPTSMVTRPMPEQLAANYRLSSAKFRSFGSKEDVFFESQPWLESDGDDDFYSVNGDMTPSITSSSSNTPVHKSLSAAPSNNPPEDITAGYKLTLSPVKRRKSLSELFRESEDEEENSNSSRDTSSSDKETDEDTTEFHQTGEVPKVVTSKPNFQEHNFANSSGDVKMKKERSEKSAHRCLPRLFSVYSTNTAKKNTIAAAY